MNQYAIPLTGVFAGGESCLAVRAASPVSLVIQKRQHSTAASGWPVSAAQLADGLAPAVGFLTGKHRLGTLLGAGSAVQLSAIVQTMTRLTAGVRVVVSKPAGRHYFYGMGMYGGRLTIVAAQGAA